MIVGNHLNFLPKNTRKLWETMQSPSFAAWTNGFVLIGGTGITLHIGHRISHDLDLVWAHPLSLGHSLSMESLPRKSLEHLLSTLSVDFGPVEKLVDIKAEQDFLNDGLELDDYQQDYLIGGVKVTFFSGPKVIADVLGAESDIHKPLHVATLDQLFQLKCLVVNERQKTRDYFDLYMMIKDHEYDLRSARSTLEKSDVYHAWDTFCSRMASLPVSVTDEGYESCLVDISKNVSLENMRDFFEEKIAEIDYPLRDRAVLHPEQEILPNEEAATLREQQKTRASRNLFGDVEDK